MANVTEDNQEQPPKKPSKYDKFYRTPKLATPKQRREKFDYPPYEYKSVVPATALTMKCNTRCEDMARPPIRRLQDNKKNFSPVLGPYYGQALDKKMVETWSTIYHYYDRLKKELKKKGKGATEKSQKSQKSKAEMLAQFQEWVKGRALPKKIFFPPPIDRGKKLASIDSIQPHLSEMASPKRVPSGYLYPRDLDLPIPKEVLTYIPTDRIYEISRPRADRALPSNPPGVSIGALKYNPSPRILELCVPKTSREKRDTDLKENPFSVSPAALKYKATDRIIELAKPVERD